MTIADSNLLELGRRGGNASLRYVSAYYIHIILKVMRKCINMKIHLSEGGEGVGNKCSNVNGLTSYATLIFRWNSTCLLTAKK